MARDEAALVFLEIFERELEGLVSRRRFVE